jgi:hypothetical protein
VTDRSGGSGWGEILQLAFTAAVAVLFLVTWLLAIFGVAPLWLFLAALGAGFVAATINHIDARRTGRPLPPD